MAASSRPVRVIRHYLDGIGAIDLEDPQCPSGADGVAVQENHDFAHGLLFGPGGENAGGPNRPDAFDLAQPIRSGLDDVENLLAECAHALLGGNCQNVVASHRPRGDFAAKSELTNFPAAALCDPCANPDHGGLLDIEL